MSLQDGVADCRDMLARCRDVANSGQWKDLVTSGNAYMEAFDQLKAEVAQANPDDEDLLVMRSLEIEQRQLIGLIRRRQQAIQEQLKVLSDAQRRLHRVRDMAQAIEEGRL